MGRFYKTTPGKFLDFMYKLPKEQMLKAIEIADTQINKTEQDLRKQEDLLKLNSIEYDTPEAKKIVQGHMEAIDEMAKEIQRDPLSFRRAESKISSLRRNIEEDFNYGDASRIQSNYERREENLKGMETMYEKSPDKFNYDDIQKLQGILDQQYAENKGHKGGAYKTERLAEYQDLKDFDAFGKGWKAQITEKLGAYKSPKTGLLYTSKDYKEEVKASDIEAAIADMIKNDDKLKTYYDQQIKIGNLTKEERDAKFDETAKAIGEKYGYLTTKKGSTSIKADSRDAATAAVDRAYELNHPTNATPGTIQDKPLIAKYGGTSLTTAGLTTAIGQISNVRKDLVTVVAAELGSKAGITVTTKMQKDIEEGRFDFLEQNGFSKELIKKYKSTYANLEFDQRVLTAMQEQANRQPNPDQWLAKHSPKESQQILVNETPGGSFAKSADRTLYTKLVASHQKEIAESPTWHDKEIRFDKGDIEKLPADNLLRILVTASDGSIKPTSVYKLIEEGIILPKTATVNTPIKYVHLDGTPADGPGLGRRAVKGSSKGEIDTAEYANFKVSPYAKFATALDSEDQVIIQTQMQIGKYGIDFYINERDISNSSVKQFLDTDQLKAQSYYSRAKKSGVINKDGFTIQGVTFKTRALPASKKVEEFAEVGGQTISTEAGIELIGEKLKSQ